MFTYYLGIGFAQILYSLLNISDPDHKSLLLNRDFLEPFFANLAKPMEGLTVTDGARISHR